MKDYSQITDALLHGILVFDGPIQCPSGARHVAADSVGAGNGEWVLVVTGSSARKANGGDLPIDLSVIGIVDQVVIEDQVTYRK
ncbi:MAG: EutN/CcmL family microcompartment protein [Rhodoferax sp.]|jgi:ethanolamine utilization protein EutN|nr:EutN/CcmL family microcompartment protein [Rhodoferax sp.]